MEYQEILSRTQELLSRPVHPIPEGKLESERKLYYRAEQTVFGDIREGQRDDSRRR